MFHRLISVAAVLLLTPVAAAASPLLKPRGDCVSVNHRAADDVAAADLNAGNAILPPDYAENVNVHLNLPLRDYTKQADRFSAGQPPQAGVPPYVPGRLDAMVIETGTLNIDTHAPDPCDP